MRLQSVLMALYPPQCLSCGEETADEFSLCGACWRDMPFISGLACDACGTPLPGASEGEAQHCDTCLAAPPPWQRGRAACRYDGTARRMILALKHGDRTDLVPAMARWMRPGVTALIAPDVVLAPVPLHPRRLFFRRYNQSALLTRRLSRDLGVSDCPDLLRRIRATRVQEGMTRPERQENQRGAIAVAPRRRETIEGRPVLLVDDVMTTGATLAACAEACLSAGAARVDVAVLARVARDA
jgi:ComF family protein